MSPDGKTIVSVKKRSVLIQRSKASKVYGTLEEHS